MAAGGCYCVFQSDTCKIQTIAKKRRLLTAREVENQVYAEEKVCKKQRLAKFNLFLNKQAVTLQPERCLMNHLYTLLRRKGRCHEKPLPGS